MNSTNPPNKPGVNTGARQVLADGLVSCSFLPYLADGLVSCSFVPYLADGLVSCSFVPYLADGLLSCSFVPYLADGLVSCSIVPYFHVVCILRQSSVLLRHITVIYILFVKIQSCHFEIYSLVLSRNQCDHDMISQSNITRTI